MIIIDGHEDIAYNALEWGRDPRLSLFTIREQERQSSCCDSAGGTSMSRGIAMSSLAELRRGGIGIVFGVIFARPSGSDEKNYQSQLYRNAEEAYRIGQGQLAYYKALAEETGIALVLNRSDLQDMLIAWRSTKEGDDERPLGIVPLMEGADPIRTPAEAAHWFANGLRIVGLAWRGTRYSGGTHAPGPVTPAGRELLSEMERVGLILDMSHLAEESFWQALEYFHGHVIASHSNCRVFNPSDRHLSDGMIRALVERDGVIGILPGNAFLDGKWGRPHRFEMSFHQVVRHIDHICQLTSNARHVGIGSDIDGGFGRDETPSEMETVADLATLADALRGAGYKEEDVVNIMGGNWRRFLEQALPGNGDTI